MSSILKSLKKLENETERGLLSSKPPPFNSRQTLRRRITSDRRSRLWVFSLIAAGVLVAGGWYLTRSRLAPTPSPPASPSPPAVMKPEKMAQGAPSPIALSSRGPAPDLPATQPIRTRAVMPERADIPDATAFQNQEKNDSPPSHRMTGESSAPGPIAPERVPALSPLSPEKPSSAPVKPQATAADTSDPAPLPADAGLKLEALAWASAAESRFVVINSQIVREGDMIEGARVERIEKEQVVLRKDGKLWRLRHRPQR